MAKRKNSTGISAAAAMSKPLTLADLKPWCWYCDREFDDLKVLIAHQRQKHFSCNTCQRRLNSPGGLAIHMTQVHRMTLSKVPSAMPGRDTLRSNEVHGMDGIPPEDLLKRLEMMETRRRKALEQQQQQVQKQVKSPTLCKDDVASTTVCGDEEDGQIVEQAEKCLDTDGKDEQNLPDKRRRVVEDDANKKKDGTLDQASITDKEIHSPVVMMAIPTPVAAQRKKYSSAPTYTAPVGGMPPMHQYAPHNPYFVPAGTYYPQPYYYNGYAYAYHPSTPQSQVPSPMAQSPSVNANPTDATDSNENKEK